MSIKILNIHDKIKKEEKFNFLNPSRSCIEVWKNYIKNNNLNLDINNLMCCIENCNNIATDGAHVFISIDGNEQPGTYLAPTCHIPHNYSDIIQNKKYGETHKYNLTKFNKLEYFYLFPGSIELDNDIKKKNQDIELDYQPNIVPNTVPDFVPNSVPDSIPSYIPSSVPNSSSDRHGNPISAIIFSCVCITLIIGIIIIIGIFILFFFYILQLLCPLIFLFFFSIFLFFFEYFIGDTFEKFENFLISGVNNDSNKQKKKINIILYLIFGIISFLSFILSPVFFSIYYHKIGQKKKRNIIFIFSIIYFILLVFLIIALTITSVCSFVVLCLVYAGVSFLLATFTVGMSFAFLWVVFPIWAVINIIICFIIFLLFCGYLNIIFLVVFIDQLYLINKYNNNNNINEDEFGGIILKKNFYRLMSLYLINLFKSTANKVASKIPT